jgi:hypothetical protein
MPVPTYTPISFKYYNDFIPTSINLDKPKQTNYFSTNNDGIKKQHRQQEAIEKQQEDVEKQQEAIEKQQEDVEKQQEDVEKNRYTEQIEEFNKAISVLAQDNMDKKELINILISKIDEQYKSYN